MADEAGKAPKPTQNGTDANQPAAPADRSGLPKLRTMKYDAAQYLKDKNLSFLDLVAKEQTRRESQSYNFSYRERASEHTWLKIVIGLVVLVTIGLAGYMAFSIFLQQPATPGISEEEPPQAYLATEGRDIFSIRENDRAGLFDKLRASRRDRLPSRSIKQVVVKLETFEGVARFATLGEFLTLLGAQPPAGFTGNFKDTFNLLIYYRPTGADVGMILEPKNADRAFAQMLAWERTMILDLNKLYLDDNVPATTNPFQDTVVKNVDARVLSITETASLSYATFARRYLLISTSKEFLEIMIGRLLIAPPA